MIVKLHEDAIAEFIQYNQFEIAEERIREVVKKTLSAALEKAAFDYTEMVSDARQCLADDRLHAFIGISENGLQIEVACDNYDFIQPTSIAALIQEQIDATKEELGQEAADKEAKKFADQLRLMAESIAP